jgi:hypothetical protein
VRNDIQGIDIYPAEEDIVFLRFGPLKAKVGKSVEGFTTEIRDIGARLWQPSMKQRVASELFCASFFDLVYRSRFITLVTAVEALLEPRTRSVSVQDIIDQAKALTATLSKLEPARESLLSSLEHLREDSIGQAGRHLADQLLGNKIYTEMTPGKFFSKCYSIRSQTVHNGIPDDPDVDFLVLANLCQQFVGDLLLASFASSAANSGVEPAGAERRPSG